jgi:hypothetical protein
MRKLQLPTLKFSDGALELLKWLALALMIGDHINKYLLNGTVDLLFYAGRIAMPIFVTVLAYNLARPGALTSGAYGRTMCRLGGFGALATPAFIALGGIVDGWWPLNILFTLMTLSWVLACLDRGGWWNLVAVAAFLLGGSVVEFWWPALALGVSVWAYTKKPSRIAALAAFAALIALHTINGNDWALVALPILLLASKLRLNIVRLRWFFYAFYPAHLAIIWALRIPMREAGYLFFT